MLEGDVFRLLRLNSASASCFHNFFLCSEVTVENLGTQVHNRQLPGVQQHYIAQKRPKDFAFWGEKRIERDCPSVDGPDQTEHSRRPVQSSSYRTISLHQS
jgi:hypothetical protein